MNPLNKDQSSLGGSGTHFADFMIGVTDKKPSINTGNPNLLDGWDPLELFLGQIIQILMVQHKLELVKLLFYQKKKFYLVNIHILTQR